MKKLGEKLEHPQEPKQKDDDTLYGELLTAKLEKLSGLNKLRAKYEIDNLMFKYMIAHEEESEIVNNFTVNEPTSPEYRPLQRNSTNSGGNLPPINALHNLQRITSTPMSTFTAMLNESSSKAMTPLGDLIPYRNLYK